LGNKLGVKFSNLNFFVFVFRFTFYLHFYFYFGFYFYFYFIFIFPFYRVASGGKPSTPGEARKAAGHFVAAIMNRKLDLKGWQLVITGHSLGAGAAALIALKLYGRFPGHPAQPSF